MHRWAADALSFLELKKKVTIFRTLVCPRICLKFGHRRIWVCSHAWARAPWNFLMATHSVTHCVLATDPEGTFLSGQCTLYFKRVVPGKPRPQHVGQSCLRAFYHTLLFYGTTRTTTQLGEFTRSGQDNGNLKFGGHLQVMGYAMYVRDHHWPGWLRTPVGRRLHCTKFLESFGDTYDEVGTKPCFHKACNLLEKALLHQIGARFLQGSEWAERCNSILR